MPRSMKGGKVVRTTVEGIPPEALAAVDLRRRAELERMFCGALRSCIDAHGPITLGTASSAAKRLVSVLKGARKDAASGVWSDLSSEACGEGNEPPTEAA